MSESSAAIVRKIGAAACVGGRLHGVLRTDEKLGRLQSQPAQGGKQDEQGKEAQPWHTGTLQTPRRKSRDGLWILNSFCQRRRHGGEADIALSAAWAAQKMRCNPQPIRPCQLAMDCHQQIRISLLTLHRGLRPFRLNKKHLTPALPEGKAHTCPNRRLGSMLQ